MKIDLTLRYLSEVADPAMLIIVGCLFVIIFGVMCVLFRERFLLITIFVVGSCVQMRFGPLNVVGLIGRFPLVLLLAIAGLSYNERFKSTRMEWAYLLFCGVIGLQLIRGFSMTDSLIKFSVFLLCFFGIIMYTSKVCLDEQRWSGVFKWLIGWAVLMIWIQVPFPASYGRMTGIFEMPGMLQNTLLRGLTILILYFFVRGYKTKFMPLLVITLIVGSGLLILSGGRTAILALFFGLFFIFRIRPTRILFIGAALGILGAIALIAILPRLEQFEVIASHVTSTSSSFRLEMWQVVWEKVMERPLVGYGEGENEIFAILKFGHTVHNSFLSMAYDYGLIITGAFLLTLIILLFQAWYFIAKLDYEPLREMAALSGALITGIFVAAFLGSNLGRLNIEWFLLCFSIGLLNAVKTRSDEIYYGIYNTQSMLTGSIDQNAYYPTLY